MRIMAFIEKHNRGLVFDVLFLISLIGTTFLFWNFTDNFMYRIYWITTGIGAVELFRVYVLKQWKKKIAESKKIYSTRLESFYKRTFAHTKYLPILGIYLILATVSGTATVAVSINTIEMQSQQARSSTVALERQSIETRIRQIDHQIDTYLREQGDLGFNVAERIDMFNERIDALNDERRELNRELAEIAQQEVFEADSIFASLARMLENFDVDTTGDAILLSLMILMALAIEFGIIFTTDVHTTTKSVSLKEDKHKLFAYIDALTDIEDGKVRLNGEKTVAEVTGFDLDTIRRYKELLMNLKYNGKPMIEQHGKIIKKNFTTQNIKRVVETKANLE